MALKIIGIILFLIGAVVGYLAKHVHKFIFKSEPNEMDIIKMKSVGLGVFLIGFVIIFKYFR